MKARINDLWVCFLFRRLKDPGVHGECFSKEFSGIFGVCGQTNKHMLERVEDMPYGKLGQEVILSCKGASNGECLILVNINKMRFFWNGMIICFFEKLE